MQFVTRLQGSPFNSNKVLEYNCCKPSHGYHVSWKIATLGIGLFEDLGTKQKLYTGLKVLAIYYSFNHFHCNRWIWDIWSILPYFSLCGGYIFHSPLWHGIYLSPGVIFNWPCWWCKNSNYRRQLAFVPRLLVKIYFQVWRGTRYRQESIGLGWPLDEIMSE